ncbi:putative reverse transcriptase domain-containing protein [Tanacetum coccineum]
MEKIFSRRHLGREGLSRITRFYLKVGVGVDEEGKKLVCLVFQSSVKDKILAAPGEASKVENATTEMLRGLDQLMEIKYLVHSGADKTYYDLRDMYGSHLPKMKSGHDTIWVIVDKLTKLAHFLETREDYSTERLAKLYIDKKVARHRVPVLIILDRDGRSSILWVEIGESSLIGPELVQETTNKVVLIKEKLKAAKDRVIHFGTKGKLAPRYVGPFKILERISPVAYRLRLPEEFSSVHDTFYVSNLKKCLADANMHVPLDEIKIDKTLHFIEEPVEIMDHEVRSLKLSKISLVKVRWNSKHGPEFTWEREDHMKSKYP